MLSDACHDFASGYCDLKSLIADLDHYEKAYPTIYPKELIDALRELTDMAVDGAEARANLVRACLIVGNHYDDPTIAQLFSAKDLAKQILIPYAKP